MFSFKKKNRIKLNKDIRALHSNSGSTLVEMIVTFAILAIFMVAATGIIVSVTSIYYHVKGEMYANQVSELIMTKVTGEIEGAKVYDEAGGSHNAENPYLFSYKTTALDSSGAITYGSSKDWSSATPSYGTKVNMIDLYDKTDTHVAIYRKENNVIIHYFEFTDSEGTKVDPVDWRFDTKAFMGFEVTNLEFTQLVLMIQLP